MRTVGGTDTGVLPLPPGAALVARQGSHTVARQPLREPAPPPLVLAPGRYTIEITGTAQSCDRVQVTVTASQRVDVTLNCPGY